MSFPLLAFLFIVIHEYIGLAYQFPILRVIPFVLLIIFTMLIYVVKSNGLKDVFSHRQSILFVCFIMLTALALSHGYVRSYAVEPLKQEIGFFFLTIVGFYVLDSKDKIDKFVFVFVCCHVYLSFINFGKFHGPRTGGYTGGVFLGDGNDFAWSLCLTFPMALYLVSIQKSFLRKSIAIAMSCILLYGITGTQSRGATLALVASGMFYWLFFSKAKSKSLLLIGITVFSLTLILPQAYFGRLETLENYQQDDSARNRIIAWKAATKMAVDHPILGVGAGSYNSVYGRFYRDENSPARWISTHSVYFNILAEYSFIGLLLYLSIIYLGLTESLRTRRLILENPDRVSLSHRWPEFLSMSIIAFAVAAMFLTGVDYPHIYLLTALAMATNRIVVRDLEKHANTASEQASTGTT